MLHRMVREGFTGPGLESGAEEKQENISGPGNSKYKPDAKLCLVQLEEWPGGQCGWSLGVGEQWGEG